MDVVQEMNPDLLTTYLFNLRSWCRKNGVTWAPAPINEKFESMTKRQPLMCIRLYTDKKGPYYLYFRSKYITNTDPILKANKVGILTSLVIVEWTAGSYNELGYLHIDDASHIQDMFKLLRKVML